MEGYKYKQGRSACLTKINSTGRWETIRQTTSVHTVTYTPNWLLITFQMLKNCIWSIQLLGTIQATFIKQLKGSTTLQMLKNKCTLFCKSEK